MRTLPPYTRERMGAKPPNRPRNRVEAFHRFVALECVVGRGETVRAALLYATYHDWCARYGLPRMSREAFTSAVINEVGPAYLRPNGKMWTGIGLRTIAPP